ncbi:SLATT domain-containing protein [Phenylobacterium sp.]|jgi:hypothetical protein|uniref:SLATT domain-containing protein n=1 Tax=Phenylobacterium sp. TaxID=1871053 RepID=UPI0035B26D6C
MTPRFGVVAGLDVEAAPDADLTELLAGRTEFASARIAGYRRRRRLAQFVSNLLRSFGCAALAVGAVLPALREAVPGLAGLPIGGFAFGYVLLGLGAAALAADRVFGIGRAVPRLQAAELGIAGELDLFHADWAAYADVPVAERRRRRLDLARAFTAEVNRLVRREAERAQEMAG